MVLLDSIADGLREGEGQADSVSNHYSYQTIFHNVSALMFSFLNSATNFPLSVYTISPGEWKMTLLGFISIAVISRIKRIVNVMHTAVLLLKHFENFYRRNGVE